MSALEKELQTYREKLPGLLLEEGRFVLIHNGDAVRFAQLLMCTFPKKRHEGVCFSS